MIIPLGYILGSIPMRYLVSRQKSIDIFETGNGNPGTANIYSSVGNFYGYVVFAADILKGALPVLLVQ